MTSNSTELEVVSLTAVHWMTRDNEERFNLYAIGADGAVYKKIGNNDNRGWRKLNMTIEFEGE